MYEEIVDMQYDCRVYGYGENTLTSKHCGENQ